MKTFFRVLCSGLLKLTLFTAAITASLVAVIGSSGTIKKSLSESKLYDHVVENVFTDAQKNLNAEGQQVAGEASPELKQAAQTAFTPDLLKGSSEQIIDSVYKWLDGDTKLPDFNVDLGAAKQQFIAAAGQAAEQHAASLPLCTTEQLQTLDISANVFSIPCRPSSLSPADARQQTVAELSSSEFLKDPVLSAQSLPKNENGRTVFEEVHSVQSSFKLLKILPAILLIVSALLAAAVFFLSDSYRLGVKSLGISFLSTGLLLFVGTWLVSWFFDRAAAPNGLLGKDVTNELQKAALAAARSLNSAFSHTLLWYCITYVVLGIAALIGIRFIKRRVAAAPGSETAAPAPVKTEEAPPEEKKAA